MKITVIIAHYLMNSKNKNSIKIEIEENIV